MKTVYHSAKELSRCSHCNRHNQVSKEDLLQNVNCEFCHKPLLSQLDALEKNQASHHQLGSFGQKLLVGLVGATLGLSACEQEEVEVQNTADYQVQQSDEFLAQPEYGVPVGDFDVLTPDQLLAEPVYGAPVGDFAVVEPSDAFLPQPEYGAPVGDFELPSSVDMSMGKK